MKNKDIYFKIADYLSLGKFSKATTLIKNNPIELDITYDKGIFFDFAIKHNNTEMLRTLLNYFEQTQLQGDIDSREHQLAKYNLRKILEGAVDSFEISEEMEKVLAPYLPQEEEDYQLDLMNDLLVAEDNHNPDYETFETVKIGEHHENPDQILI